MEQFIILLLAAFAVMLVITLASQPWKNPERTPVLALFVAVAALLWSGINTYFTWFWHPEDLRVYLRFPSPLQVGTDKLDISYFFSNMGNQTVLVEDVAMDELWINSNRTNIGGAELHRCDDVGGLGDLLLAIPPPGDLLRGHLSWGDGGLLAPIRPTTIYIEGARTNSSSITIEPGKMKVITATYETDPAPTQEYNTVIICPTVRFFDSKGQPVLAVCRGWQQTHAPRGTELGPPPGGPPAKLLPVASLGSCLTAYRSLTE